MSDDREPHDDLPPETDGADAAPPAEPEVEPATTPSHPTPPPVAAPRDDVDDDAYQAARSVSPWMYVFLVGLLGLVIGLVWLTVEQISLGENGVLIGWFFVSIACVLSPVAWHAVDVLNAMRESSQRAKAGVFVTLTIVFGLVAFVAVSVANILLPLGDKVLDFTESARFTVDAETRAVLDEAEGDVYLTYLVSRGTQPGLRQRAIEQMMTYGRTSDRVEVRQFVPLRDKVATEQYLREVGVPQLPSDARQDLLVVSYAEPGKEVADGKYKEIAVDPTTWVERNAMDEELWLGERLITSAIRELAFETRTIHFTGGHGEVALREGYTQLRNRLAGQNLTLESAPLDLARTQEVPEDCDLLVVANPQSTFTPEEISAIRAYLADGGELLLFLEPRSRADPLGLEPLLQEYGLSVNPSYTVVAPILETTDQSGRAVVTYNQVFPAGVQEYGNHPAVKSLRAQMGLRVFFLQPGFVDVSEDPPPGVDVVEVVHAPEYPIQRIWPWAARLDGTGRSFEAPIEGQDVQGRRLPLVATSRRGSATTDAESRVTVVCDMDMFSDELVRQGAQPNLDLAVGLTQWLLEREALVSIGGATMEAEVVPLTPGGRRSAKYWPLVTILLPLLVGSAVWWARRR